MKVSRNKDQSKLRLLKEQQRKETAFVGDPNSFLTPAVRFVEEAS